MSSRFLLDTNASIAYIAKDENLVKLVEDAEEIFIPVFALGELFYGAEKSGRAEANRFQVETFAASGAVLNCDTGSARQYGRVHHSLRLKGRPIPQNDMWIAAIALQHGLTLLTKDAHFNDVDGLAIQGW